MAYAHGQTLSTGDAKKGIYKIRETKSHVDVDGVRYWQPVYLDFWGAEGTTKMDEELIVSSAGYQVGPLPEKKVGYEGFGNVMIESVAMLSVYDNSEPGIVLLVI